VNLLKTQSQPGQPSPEPPRLNPLKRILNLLARLLGAPRGDLTP
jgi:hypothetical protein